MSKTQEKISETLFWLQIFVTVAFFIPFQTYKMLEDIGGLILTSFLFVAVYCSLNLWLAINACRAKRDRVTVQLVIIWILGVLLYVLFSIVFAIKAETIWNARDTVNSICAIAGAVVAGTIMGTCRLPITHPDVKMYLGIAFRVVPQLTLAVNIAIKETGDGLHWAFVWGFHFLIACRIVTTGIAVSKEGWHSLYTDIPTCHCLHPTWHVDYSRPEKRGSRKER